MSTSNFFTQKNFKLMAWGMNGEDDIDFRIMKEDFQQVLDKMKPLDFFELRLESGYYEGVQVVIDYQTSCIWGEYDDPRNVDNEDCQAMYGMCRSKAIRKHDSEINYINNKLFAELKKIGFIELSVSARFSNGETWYSKVA